MTKASGATNPISNLGQSNDKRLDIVCSPESFSSSTCGGTILVKTGGIVYSGTVSSIKTHLVAHVYAVGNRTPIYLDPFTFILFSSFSSI